MRLADIFFTKKCIGCGKTISVFGKENLCKYCRPDFESIAERIFYVNGLEFLKACYLYDGKVRLGIRRFKFNNDGYTGRIFAENLAEMMKNEPLLPSDYIIVSVPGRIKDTDREYVQADFLANNVARLLKKEYSPDVVRKKSSARSQTRCLTAAERKENIKGNFKINSGLIDTVKGKNIIIIDDISTTGATLSEMADVLHTAGAKKIYGICVAKTPNPCDRKERNIIINPDSRKTIEVIKKT